MQTHRCCVVAASLGTDAVDGFLDAVRDMIGNFGRRLPTKLQGDDQA